MFPTTIHEGHTNECVKPQQAARKTVSANKLEWFDMTSVADGKSNWLQYHENTRVTTGAKTVTMNLVTHSLTRSKGTVDLHESELCILWIIFVTLVWLGSLYFSQIISLSPLHPLPAVYCCSLLPLRYESVSTSVVWHRPVGFPSLSSLDCLDFLIAMLVLRRQSWNATKIGREPRARHPTPRNLWGQQFQPAPPYFSDVTRTATKLRPLTFDTAAAPCASNYLCLFTFQVWPQPDLSGFSSGFFFFLSFVWALM